METENTTPDPTTIPERLLYPVPEARALLGGLSHSGFYQLVKAGTIRLTKIGRRSFVEHDELGAIVTRLSAQGADKQGDGDEGPQAPEAGSPAAA